MADQYVEVLGDLIGLLKDYKPGTITIENITKLCQSMGLESFIDELDNDISRLSTASKIIVIDIDYNKTQSTVQDVKLVLASNFDNFDYSNEQLEEAGDKQSNILLNSLTNYDSLKQFHHNLEFLYLLDTYSSVESDNQISSGNNLGSGNGTNGSSLTNKTDKKSVSSGNGLDSKLNEGKLNLFKYFRELKKYINTFFKENCDNRFKVVANVDNRFGLYIYETHGYSMRSRPLAKVYFERAKVPQQRFYEYIYSSETGSWINENSENYSVGVNLILEVNFDDTDEDVFWFPKEFVPTDLFIDEKDQLTSRKVSDVLCHAFYELGSSKKQTIELMNDFTTDLIQIRRFNINNDNLDLIADILNWTIWYRTVLRPIYLKLVSSISDDDDQHIRADIANTKDEFTVENTNPEIMKGPTNKNASFMQRNSMSLQRRRRSSNKAKRPSMSEAVVFKDEGLQQFSLHEIMADTTTEPDQKPDNLNISNNSESFIGQQELMEGSNIINDDKMDIDEEAINDDDSDSQSGEEGNIPVLLVNEDHVSFKGLGSCSFYDDKDKWAKFVEDLFNVFS